MHDLQPLPIRPSSKQDEVAVMMSPAYLWQSGGNALAKSNRTIARESARGAASVVVAGADRRRGRRAERGVLGAGAVRCACSWACALVVACGLRASALRTLVAPGSGVGPVSGRMRPVRSEDVLRGGRGVGGVCARRGVAGRATEAAPIVSATCGGATCAWVVASSLGRACPAEGWR